MNRSIGLALSGGGTKGLAHAGVLQFLTEQKIQPNYIAGTSAGAIIAALYAAGKTPVEILDFFKSIYFFNWRHFTFTKAGFIDAEAFKAYFKTIFKDTCINELPIPIYIAATDLIKGESIVFDGQTKIVDAILASSAFPGVFSPYEFEGNLYSDGGILNHFPTDLLPESSHFNIGVYVSPIQQITPNSLKSIKAVTARSFDLLFGNSSAHKFSNCHWVIQPDALTRYGTFETNKTKMDEIYEIGYAESKKSFALLENNLKTHFQNK
ncbi:patatin-like phospholipase family protein [Flavobacterium sp.]|uniref:patatin-like phospholipase family protein n=1 Tax=Flavobacterium sp. TaxID=239 RepID=UPI003D13BCD5